MTQGGLLSRSYRLFTDEKNVNPFTGSFVNYHWVIRLYPVSLTNSTVMRVYGSFQTEPETAQTGKYRYTFSCLGKCISEHD